MKGGEIGTFFEIGDGTMPWAMLVRGKTRLSDVEEGKYEGHACRGSFGCFGGPGCC